ncbi:hypothetical protein KK083_21490 [Fulvivirgaceae bacterium PWU4]|uniref:Uncharacterized protein n=1 Tax=Chryseosolibacter histidini TaxID=2782349 RepID=A0AAP2GKN0_9BACT|nr:hypothetical protein [Chryseosolibacter histidini]MBT1699486.1 hypothetical protein [Chryseosolibacter histidini]
MLSRIKTIFRQYGYVLHSAPYKLNIAGLRARSTVANSFDDEMHVFYTKPDGKWNYHVYQVTTDPGTFWLNNPAYPEGTAILDQGQYQDAYAIGLHRGLYTALVQVKPVTVMRDYDRNSVLDFYNGIRQTGNFGINIHRAESSGATKYIDNYSAGCQVFQDAEEFDEFIELCERHKELYGNAFTYTLIDFRAMSRVTLKRIVTASTIAAGIAIGLILRFDD